MILLSDLFNYSVDRTYRGLSASFHCNVRIARDRSGRSEGGEPKD